MAGRDRPDWKPNHAYTIKTTRTTVRPCDHCLSYSYLRPRRTDWPWLGGGASGCRREQTPVRNESYV